MTDAEFNTLLGEVISSLEEKDYEPYGQIYGYVQTGNDTYITRHGNARGKIKLSVRITVKDHVHLKRQAEAAGLKIEPLIRKLIMGCEICQRPRENIAQLIGEVSAIGNNINQIAREINSFDRVSQDELSEMRMLLREIYHELKPV